MAKPNLTNTRAQRTKNREKLKKLTHKQGNTMTTQTVAKQYGEDKEHNPTPLATTLQLNLLAETTMSRGKGQRPNKGG